MGLAFNNGSGWKWFTIFGRSFSHVSMPMCLFTHLKDAVSLQKLPSTCSRARSCSRGTSTCEHTAQKAEVNRDAGDFFVGKNFLPKEPEKEKDMRDPTESHPGTALCV